MSYLLDTNAWVVFLRDRHPGIHRKVVHELGPADLRLCSVVKAELLYGAHRSGRAAENLMLLADLFGIYASLPFDDRAADAYGRLRVDLERRGQRIGPHDLMIASIALANNLTLVTHNVHEFARVPDLRMEDWET